MDTQIQRKDSLQHHFIHFFRNQGLPGLLRWFSRGPIKVSTGLKANLLTAQGVQALKEPSEVLAWQVDLEWRI